MEFRRLHWLLAALAVVVFWSGCKDSTTTTPPTPGAPDVYVRKNAHSPEAQPDIEALRVAIDTMKKIECTNPLSWYYQGAIHHIPDTIANLPDTLCAAYQNKGNYLPGFSTCPHMKPGYMQFHFLTWHRLYIWYWERIVRKFSGKADFALPYWNYNRADQRALPEKYRLPASLGDNPIYEPGRSLYLLAGNAIAANDSDGIVFNLKRKVTEVCKQSMEGALDTADMWAASNISIFSMELENGTHNVIHDYVGGAVNAEDVKQPIYNRIYQQATTNLQGLMAMVPSAGFDPIFFAHHANIDRLWYNWELDFPAQALTWEDFEKAGPWSYVFFDENGKKIEYTSMKMVFDSIRAINYTYDYLKDRSAAPKNVGARPLVAAQLAHSVSPNKVLKGKGDVLDIPLPVGAFAKRGNGHLSLEVEVSFARATRAHLAIGIAADDSIAEAALCQAHLVNVVGFFGAGEHMHAGHDHGDKPADGRIHKVLWFDITDELKAQNGLDPKKLQLFFQVFHGEADNPIHVDKVTFNVHPE